MALSRVGAKAAVGPSHGHDGGVRLAYDLPGSEKGKAAREFMEFYYRRQPRPYSQLLQFMLDHEDSWWTMAKEVPFFQVYSREDVDAIAKALRGMRVMEVACGNGYLSYWLSQKGVRVTAVDNYSSHSTRRAAPIRVHRMDFRSALRKFKPEAVICSWMPQHQNWSEDFAMNPSLMQYIIISDDPIGVTGTPESVMAYPGWVSGNVDGFIGLARTDFSLNWAKRVEAHHTFAVSFVREEALEAARRS